MKKFGTFKGVFVPSFEAILGTVLFLLLPALTVDVGLLPMLMVIVLSHTVTIATAFSIADCATNLNQVGGGGMYALSKRSLGLSFGGSIGIQLFIAQAASIGFYCIGFSEPLYPIISSHLQNVIPAIASGTLFYKQVFSTVILLLFFVIVMFGADFTLKIQMIILFVLSLSVLSIFAAPFINSGIIEKGIFTGNINLYGMRPITVSLFILTFTQFFPAVTGIDAGVGMSGELKNPKKSLVTGTFASISITFVIYIISAAVYSTIRGDGFIVDYHNNQPVGRLLTEVLGFNNDFPRNAVGLIVFAGILFATGSSALSCFMTAPRTAQSLARDNVLPRFLHFLSRDFIANGTEPRFAVVVTFFIALAVIWMGNINTAAMIVGICFLTVYGWVNGSAFLERISRNPTFRPTSKGHWLISLYGYAASLIAIFIFSWQLGFLIIAVQLIIFRLILTYKEGGKLEGVWWGVIFTFMTSAINLLNSITQGTKNWRPIVTAISVKGDDRASETVALIAEMLSQHSSFVHYHHIVTSKDLTKIKNGNDGQYDLSIIQSDDPTETVMSMVQMNFYGNLSPNTVLMGFSRKIDNVKIIKKVLSLNKNILLLKNGEKFKDFNTIDIWWRGEKNGNLMVLLAYIINSTMSEKSRKVNIRIIRKLGEREKEKTAQDEMETLLSRARISGEVVIIPHNDEEFLQTVVQVSSKSDLIMMGIPGNYIESQSKSFFNLNEYFFNKEIHKYDTLPTILFVKSASVLNLIED
ncbi:MAG TPA: amino acid permease [Spirochaetota bacterium]|nr:amino acid permease [Spirochaetota bacterium]HOM09596.1 amino acid permease [Spirochaetota bacterium]